MNTTLTYTTLSLLLAAGACPAQCLVIDNFTTGKYKVQLSAPDATTTNYSDPNYIQTGSMLGGSRETAFEVAGNPFGQIGELSVANHPALVIGTGTREFFRLDLVYGQSLTAPLKYFPAGCDRFRVTFDSSSQQGINFNVVVWQHGGPGYSLGINVFPTPTGQPFCVDFPFDKFVTNAGVIPSDFPDKGIDSVDLVLQSGAAVGANAFAMTRVETASPATAAAKRCAFIATNQ
jgi:hypothetical protein